MLLRRGRARYHQHFTDMQEPSGIERRDMAITNNTPGEALWTRGCPTEDHQIRSRDCTPSVKANEKKKSITLSCKVNIGIDVFYLIKSSSDTIETAIVWQLDLQF
jgi:hypothetical protein